LKERSPIAKVNQKVAMELGSYKYDFLGVQKVRWKEISLVQAKDYIVYGKEVKIFN
jgi:hypothetical protein